MNRRTWRVGHHLWITSMDAPHRELLELENRLLERLEVTFREPDFGLQVPHVIAARSGATIVEEELWCFRATAHLDGRRPDGEAMHTHAESARALRILHEALQFESADLAVTPPFLAEVEAAIERTLGSAFAPVTQDEDEHELVCRVAEQLNVRLPDLLELPCQLIHGDWSTPNLLIGESGSLTAVLDWQMATFAPPIVDLSQVFSGVLMFSSLPIEEAGPVITASYGIDYGLDLLRTAMAAYWFRNYWFGRREFELDPRLADAIERQPGRLRGVLAYTGWA